MSIISSSTLVVPALSKEEMLDMHPIYYTFPAGSYPPIIVDIATSTAANGKLEVAQRKNHPIPSGWVQDPNGNPSIDAGALKEGGSLLPLGGDRDHGSHKGFALSASVDIFSAVLSGANYGPWAPPFVAFLDPLDNAPGAGLGHYI